MNPKGNWLELVVICALFVLLSIWGIIWDITSGLLTGGIDGNSGNVPTLPSYQITLPLR